MEGEAAVEVEVEEVAEAPRQEEQRQEEETRSSSERNHPPSAGIAKTSIDSFQTSRDTCP